MRRYIDFDHRPWFIVPVRPGLEKNYWRWNIALISALLFIVVGVFVMTMTPGLSRASAHMHKGLAPAASQSNAGV
jgi:hypothetical protein